MNFPEIIVAKNRRVLGYQRLLRPSVPPLFRALASKSSTGRHGTLLPLHLRKLALEVRIG
jgi:hypothetical protein